VSSQVNRSLLPDSGKIRQDPMYRAWPEQQIERKEKRFKNVLDERICVCSFFSQYDVEGKRPALN